LTVTAKDLATNKEQHITIENNNKISDEEVERYKAEAKEHEEEDRKFKEEAEKANRCEGLIYQTEQQLETFKDNDKFTEDDKKFFTDKVEELKKVKENSDYSKLDEIEKEMQAKWFELSSKLYQQPNGGVNPEMVNEMFKNGTVGQQPTESDLENQEA
jgi:molecular chaperone DnaK